MEYSDIIKSLTSFKIIKTIGTGAFGIIFSSIDEKRNIKVAIKLEKRPNIRVLIDKEYKILKHFHNGVTNLIGFPKIYDRYMI